MDISILDGEKDLKGLAYTLLKEHKELSSDNSEYQSDIAYYKSELEKNKLIIEKQERRIARYKSRLAKILAARFTKSSEKQKQSIEEPQYFDESTVADSSNTSNTHDEDDETCKKRKRSRSQFIDQFPAQKEEYDIPEANKVCECGANLKLIGTEELNQLEHIPAKFRARKIIKNKYSCPCCKNVVTAKSPPQIIPKSYAAPSLLSSVLVNKYEYHLPYYRQESIYEAIGFDLPRNTMSNWTLKVGIALEPLVNLMKDKLRDSSYVQADETYAQVLNEEGKTAESTSYIWAYKTGEFNKNLVIYDYQPNRKSENPLNFLDGFKGVLQTDGYSGYDKLCKDENITRAGCMAHARRKLYNIAKNNKNSKANRVVDLIGKLYKIEKQIKDLAALEKQTIRQSHAKPIYTKMINFLSEQAPKVPPKSELGSAILYTLKRETELGLYINNGILNIDNNAIENCMRPFALGRKNWLFMGNAKTARAAANIYSIMQSAKMNNLDLHKYLTFIFEKIPIVKTVEDLEKLLPTNVILRE